jgi:hypothetical protein
LTLDVTLDNAVAAHVSNLSARIVSASGMTTTTTAAHAAGAAPQAVAATLPSDALPGQTVTILVDALDRSGGIVGRGETTALVPVAGGCGLVDEWRAHSSSPSACCSRARCSRARADATSSRDWTS